MQLAVMYADRGDADALAQLGRIVEPSPAHREVGLYVTVRLAALRGDISAAVAAAERLVAAYQNADAWSTLGTVRALGQRDAARQAFEEALAHRPRDPAILASLARVWDE